MARVKRGVQARRRHKKILSLAKGYYNARRKVFRVAKQAVIKAQQYAYIGRKQKKRNFRSLWIVRINAAARINGLSYSPFHEWHLEVWYYSWTVRCLLILLCMILPVLLPLLKRRKACLRHNSSVIMHDARALRNMHLQNFCLCIPHIVAYRFIK